MNTSQLTSILPFLLSLYPLLPLSILFWQGGFQNFLTSKNPFTYKIQLTALVVHSKSMKGSSGIVQTSASPHELVVIGSSTRNQQTCLNSEEGFSLCRDNNACSSPFIVKRNFLWAALKYISPLLLESTSNLGRCSDTDACPIFSLVEVSTDGYITRTHVDTMSIFWPAGYFIPPALRTMYDLLNFSLETLGCLSLWDKTKLCLQSQLLSPDMPSVCQPLNTGSISVGFDNMF